MKEDALQGSGKQGSAGYMYTVWRCLMVADAKQEKLLWASELPGGCPLFCTAQMDVPQTDTAPGTLSLGCFLLLLYLLKFVMYVTCCDWT